MAFIIHETKETAIRIDEFFIKCPSCESYSWADILVISKYVHVYWIPLWPYDKEANVFCTKCGLKRYGMAFDSDLVGNYYEVKHKFKHPWHTYIGLMVIVAFFLFIVYSILIK
jgi:hypothetical protein